MTEPRGWYMMTRMTLQHAERLWVFSNTPLVYTHPADLDALDTLQLERCLALQTAPALVAAIHATDSLSLVACRLFSNYLTWFGITCPQTPLVG